MTRYVSLLLILLLLPVTASAAQRLVVPVWPHLKVPQNQRISLSFYPVGRGRHIRGPIRWPTLRVYLPPAKKANGCALVICPGGAYVEEAIGLEGYRVARWFNKLGVSCFVLKYRLPEDKYAMLASGSGHGYGARGQRDKTIRCPADSLVRSGLAKPE